MLDMGKRHKILLKLIEKGLSNWEFLRIGKRVFAKGSLSRLVVYGENVHLCVGGCVKTGKDLKQSGFYKFNKGT